VRIALFGGTFDPIHNAHLTVAREAADRFALDRVLLIPNRIPPHKPRATHAGDDPTTSDILVGGTFLKNCLIFLYYWTILRMLAAITVKLSVTLGCVPSRLSSVELQRKFGWCRAQSGLCNGF
jgi:cytidyltransferase-like protein